MGMFILGNIAYGKSAQLSRQYMTYHAGLAVDGSTYAGQLSGAYAYGGTDPSPAWWMVDLQTLHKIQRVVIYNTDSLTSKYLDKKYAINI